MNDKDAALIKKAEDDQKFIDAALSGDVDRMKSMFKAAYNPSGVRVINKLPKH